MGQLFNLKRKLDNWTTIGGGVKKWKVLLFLGGDGTPREKGAPKKNEGATGPRVLNLRQKPQNGEKKRSQEKQCAKKAEKKSSHAKGKERKSET